MKRLTILIVWCLILAGGSIAAQERPGGQRKEAEFVEEYITPTRIMKVTGDVRGQEQLLRPYVGQVSTTEPAVAVLKSSKAGKASILFDFGKELQGGVQIIRAISSDKKAAVFHLCFGESVTEAMSSVDAEGTTATNEHSVRDFETSVPWLGSMITGETASDSDLLELADIGVSVAKDVVGAAFEESDVIVGDDSFETVTDIVTTARQSHINIKRCISTAITALGTMIIFAVFNILLGTEFIISPVISSLLAVLIIPAACFIYFENTADIKNLTEPSVYIGSGHLRLSFFIRPLVQMIGLAAAEIIYYVISSGNAAPDGAGALTELTRSGFLLIFVFGLLIICISNLGRNTIFDVFRAHQTFAWMIAGITFAFSLIIAFVPVVNTALGLAAPDILSLIIAIVITILLQAPAELLRATMNRLNNN